VTSGFVEMQSVSLIAGLSFRTWLPLLAQSRSAGERRGVPLPWTNDALLGLNLATTIDQAVVIRVFEQLAK
jgi:hypothetical protein